MRWTRGYRSDDVELRGSSGRAGGGLPIQLLGAVASRFGIGGVLLLVGAYFAFNYFSGGPSQLAGGGESAPVDQRGDEQVQFVSFVLDDAQKSFDELFRQAGQRYEPAKLVIYRDATRTGCGFGSAASGPFYCPNDRTVYIDLTFYDELRRQFGAPGDFAQAYVIGHEIGHHAQNLLGLLEHTGQTGEGSQAVKQELQADCLAGVWAKSAAGRDLLEVGDIDEAMRAASAIGDDAIQRKTQGTVRPESWTHGSSQQRMQAFQRGYQGGTLQACN